MRNTFCFRNFLIFLYTLSSRNREFLLYSSCSISQLFLYYTECCISCKSNDFFSLELGKPFFFTYDLLLDSWLFHGHGPNPTYSGVVKYIEFSCVREREWILPIYLTILQYLMVRTYSCSGSVGLLSLFSYFLQWHYVYAKYIHKQQYKVQSAFISFQNFWDTMDTSRSLVVMSLRTSCSLDTRI